MQQVFQGWVKKCTLSRMVRFGGNWQYYVTPKNETGLHMDGFKRRSRGQNWKIKEKKNNNNHKTRSWQRSWTELRSDILSNKLKINKKQNFDPWLIFFFRNMSINMACLWFVHLQRDWRKLYALIWRFDSCQPSHFALCSPHHISVNTPPGLVSNAHWPRYSLNLKSSLW